jgi:hypothetical protein
MVREEGHFVRQQQSRKSHHRQGNENMPPKWTIYNQPDQGEENAETQILLSPWRIPYSIAMDYVFGTAFLDIKRDMAAVRAPDMVSLRISRRRGCYQHPVTASRPDGRLRRRAHKVRRGHRPG